MKKPLESFIRAKKNSSFRFDERITSRVLISFLFFKTLEFLRGLRIIFSFKRPRLLFFGAGVKLRNTAFIQFSDGVTIGEHVYLDGLGKKGLRIGKNSNIGSFSRLVVSANLADLGSHIHIGNNVGIGSFSSIGGSGGVDIGDDTIVGQYLSVHPENHTFSDPHIPIRQQGTTRMAIQIGSNCWLGAKVTVLAGVSIGDNAVVGAGAVVTKDIPANAIAVGNPAKVIGKR